MLSISIVSSEKTEDDFLESQYKIQANLGEITLEELKSNYNWLLLHANMLSFGYKYMSRQLDDCKKFIMGEKI